MTTLDHSNMIRGHEDSVVLAGASLYTSMRQVDLSVKAKSSGDKFGTIAVQKGENLLRIIHLIGFFTMMITICLGMISPAWKGNPDYFCFKYAFFAGLLISMTYIIWSAFG